MRLKVEASSLRIHVVGALCLASCGCASALPEPPVVRQPPEAYEAVPYPPPAGLVEVVPEQPRPSAVWVDGSWTWSGNRWVWDRGGWVIPPENGRLSRWDVLYLADGTVVFAPAVWRDPSGRPLEAPLVLAPANPPPRERTSEEAAR